MNRKNKLVTLELNPEDDPLTQLVALCKQGNYKYTFCWDFFENGIMCECEVYYKIKTRRHTIARKTYFVRDAKSIDHVKKTLAALVLNEIGLWDVPDVDAEERNEKGHEDLHKLLSIGSKAVVNHLSSFLNMETNTINTENQDANKELLKGVGNILNSMSGASSTTNDLPINKFVDLLKTCTQSTLGDALGDTLGDGNIRDRWADQE